MADLILLMPEWTNALSELMSKLSGCPATVPALLEVLLLLPEEVDSRHLRLGSNRRSQIKQMLSLSAPHIAQFLHSMLVEDGSGVAQQVSVVKCYSVLQCARWRLATSLLSVKRIWRRVLTIVGWYSSSRDL